MSLSDLAALGSFISGIAVLVSLVFLYFQLRQINAQARHNEQVHYATIRHTRAARVVDIALAAAEPSWAEAVARGLNGEADLTGAQLEQFRSYMMARLSNAEDAFYQYSEGALDAAAFDRFVVRMKVMLSAPGARIHYKHQRDHLGPEFSAFLDRLMSETPVRRTVDQLAQWKADVAAERSAENQASVSPSPLPGGST